MLKKIKNKNQSPYKVSIVVPVYNIEKYIGRCLDTLVKQTLNDIEVIVVNDGSTDNSQKVIDDYAKKHSHIIKSFIKENGGVSDARNYGIKKASAEYVGFVDGDDFVDVKMFEKLYKQAIKSKADIVVCDFYRDYGTKLQKSNKLGDCENYDTSVKDEPKLLLASSVYVWNKLFKRDLFIKNNIFFPVGQCFEDSAIIYNLLFLANKISFVEEELYYYQLSRDGSITNTVNRRMFDVIKSCENILKFYNKQNEYNDRLSEIVEFLCLHHLFVRMEAFIKSDNNKLAFEFATEMYNFIEINIPNWKENKYFISRKNRTRRRKKKFNFLITHKQILLLYLKTPKNFRSKIRNIINKVIGRKKKAKGSVLSKERLRQLQMIELNILLEVDKICKKHNITYYLGEGTLLGAARHQGFIPWDDDLDILMFRKDYEKFIDVTMRELPSHLLLLNNLTYKKYHLPLTKIVTKDNQGFINVLDSNLTDHTGPYIDIFPVDFLPFNPSKNSKEYIKLKKIRYYRYLLLFKVNYKSVNTLRKLMYRIISKFLPFKYFHKKIYKLSTKYNEDEKTVYAVNFASSYSLQKQIVPKEVYGKPKYIEFEGHFFPVPNNYKKLLKTIYDNYEELPPLHKRLPKHSFYDELSEEKV